MPQDDMGEAQELTGSEQPEMREMRSEETGAGLGSHTHEQLEQRDMAPVHTAATSTERRENTMSTVRSRPEQFLIAKKSGPLPHDGAPFDLGKFEQTLKAGDIAGCTHVRTLTRGGNGTIAAWSAGSPEAESIIVAEMPEEIAARLRQHPGLVIEPDHLLSYAQPSLPQLAALGRDPGVVIPYGTGFTASITVMGEGGVPLIRARISMGSP